MMKGRAAVQQVVTTNLDGCRSHRKTKIVLYGLAKSMCFPNSRAFALRPRAPSGVPARLPSSVDSAVDYITRCACQVATAFALADCLNRCCPLHARF